MLGFPLPIYLTPPPSSLEDPEAVKFKKTLDKCKVSTPDVDDLLALGERYLRGNGTEKSPERCFASVQAAYHLNKQNASVLYNLGWLYANGIGTHPDFGLAFQYFSDCTRINPNNSASLNRMGLCYLHGQGVVQDFKKAFEYFIRGVKSNSKSNNHLWYNLGQCFANGKGTDVNKDIAILCYKKALSQSVETSDFALTENEHQILNNKIENPTTESQAHTHNSTSSVKNDIHKLNEIIHSLQNTIADLNKQLVNKTNKISDKGEQIKVFLTKNSLLEEQVNVLSAKNIELQQQILTLTTQNEQKDQKIETLKTQIEEQQAARPNIRPSVSDDFGDIFLNFDDHKNEQAASAPAPTRAPAPAPASAPAPAPASAPAPAPASAPAPAPASAPAPAPASAPAPAPANAPAPAPANAPAPAPANAPAPAPANAPAPAPSNAPAPAPVVLRIKLPQKPEVTQEMLKNAWSSGHKRISRADRAAPTRPSTDDLLKRPYTKEEAQAYLMGFDKQACPTTVEEALAYHNASKTYVPLKDCPKYKRYTQG